MAVEIPVVIDIDKAFQDAASRVSAAIRPMQQKIDESVLEVPIEINRKGDIKEVLDFVGKTSLSMNDLKYAIKSASSELARLKRTGASEQDIATYTKAVALLKGIRAEWQTNERIASQVGDEELRNLQIQQQYNEALRMSASTLNNINAKIAGYTAMLNNSDIGSAKFEEAAIQLGKMSRQLQTVQANVKILGTHFGSIDQLNAKLQLANQQWNQMARSKKFTADGKLTAEAQALYIQYKKVTEELRKQGLTMSEMLSKEQQRAQKHQQYLTNRKKENAILNTTIKTVDALQAKINVLQSRLNKTPVGSSAFGTLNQKLRETQRELVAVQQRMSATGVEMEKADMTFGRLLKRSAYFLGLHAVTRFLNNIRDVTAEFELQRVALGGIIQDSEEANSLFRQIKAAAIQSPFEIKDLVSYTKQLSAYRVETENLFDVTMRLADVSAGLGVDMSRLILAYGQVRAASVLRGQELRQFTEAGIPLVDLLAKKFHELNGRMVSTAEVFDLISKRAVPFEMISEIFEDMTNKGGTFYKMQEKQAETLAGQWSNLKDAVSIMYDEIGNTSTVHGAMTTLISDAKFLMQNWRTVATILKSVGANFLAMKVTSLFIPVLTRNTALAEKATIALARAEQLESMQQQKSNVLRSLAITQLNAYSREMTKAAAAHTIFGRSVHQVAAKFLGGGWIGLATTALTVLVGWFISAQQEANRLNKELEKIGTDGSLQINRSVANFQRLANAAVEAADGSNEQNEALAELERTYSDIIPSQNLQIDKLRELKGNYNSLTEAIRQKINMQNLEQKVNAATDYYSGKIQKGRKKSKNLLEQYGLSPEQINAVLDEVELLVDRGMMGISDTMESRAHTIEGIIKRLTGLEVSLVDTYRYGNERQFSRPVLTKSALALNGLVDTYVALNDQTESIEKGMKSMVGTMGTYSDAWEDLQKEIDAVTVSEKDFGDKYSFSYKKEKIRREVEIMANAIEEAFAETGIDISSAFDPKGTIDFEKLNKFAEGSTKWGLQSYVKHIQDSYEAIVSTNKMVSVVETKFGELASAVDLSMDDVQGYLLRGEKDVRTYVKELGDDLQEAKDKVSDLTLRAEQAQKFSIVPAPTEEEVKKANALVSFLESLIEWLDAYQKKTKGSSVAYTQDPFIKNMQDRMKFMKDFQKGYEDLENYMSSSAAETKEASVMLTRGLSMGLSADEQKRAAKDLSQWYEDAMERTFKYLQTSKGVSGTLQEFLRRQITGNTNDDKMMKDFQDLLQSLFDAKTDFDTSQATKNIEEALKIISDNVKRSETARNFYQNILNLTGDDDLAATLSVSVYGGIGEDFKDRIRKQLVDALGALDEESFAGLDDPIRKAFQSGDYEYLVKNLEKVPEKLREVVKIVAADAEKYNADIMQDFAKLVEKFGTTEEKIATIRAKAQQEIERTISAAVTAAGSAESKEQADAILARAESIVKALEAQMDLDVFKQTDEYINFFSEINTMTAEQAALVRGEVRAAYIKAFQDGALSASQLAKELRAIDTQFKKLSEHSSLLGSYLSGGVDKAIEKLQEYADTIQILGSKISSGKSLNEGEQNFVTNMLGAFGGKFGGDSLKGIESFQDLMSTFSQNGKGVQAAGEAFSQMGEGMSAMAAEGGGALAIVDMIVKAVNQTIIAIQSVIDELNKMRSPDKQIAGWFRYVSDFNKYAYSAWENLKSGNLAGMAADVINSIVSIFNNVQLGKVNRLNKKIEEQQDILDDLKYSYGRLEAAMAKAFGNDYVESYNRQLDNLLAQQEAYLRQAELERKKGKSSDKEKIKEYENAARDTADQIADMQSQLSEFFAGTDLTSAATDFAEAWIEAYKQFGSTTDAMKEKFQDMIENMITNSLAAKLMQSILQPLFDEIDQMALSGNELSASEIGQIAAEAPDYINRINNAMTTLMNQMAAAGYNVRQQAGSFTGISRSIAGASEESINGLAAGINTQNFYISYVPTISANVAAILSVLGGSPASPNAAPNAEEGPSYEDQMLMYTAYLPQMHDDMAAVRQMLERVIKPLGVSATHYVAIR